MCEACGCGDPEVVQVEVYRSLLEANERRAAHNREHLQAAGVVAINLMGSPGSGKTALLEATARAYAVPSRLAALSGDLATERDAERLNAAGIPSLGITTGSACHLDADMVHRALHRLPWRDRDWLFVENVGNLVCPAVYDLGQTANVVALSITEGEDKPLKYPVMFHKADLVVFTKTDLIVHTGFDMQAALNAVSSVAPQAECLSVSSRTGEGIDAWMGWLARLRERVQPAEVAWVRV